MALTLAVYALGTAAPAEGALPAVRHVYVIVLENQSASATFAPGSPAPYLSKTLRARGAFLPNYYGIGHQSLDNYVAMVSGQAPNASTQADCPNYIDVLPGTIGGDGQAQGTGCIYPANVPTIAGQLTAAGLTWRSYNEDMGADPAREASVCGHPGVGMVDNTQKAEAADSYAARHNPFVYFHSIIDDTTLCDTHVVNFDLLPHDLAAAANTPTYSFITPNLCNDGHDAPCANSAPGGLVQADSFLRTWVPRITDSPAFQKENGLLIITFDEGTSSDTSSCCGEMPGPGSPSPGVSGPGGGKVGALLLSPCIAPGTVSNTSYNHYTMLRSVEDLYGLPHIGYAGLPGGTSFGSDIFTRKCGPEAPVARVRAPAIASSAAATPRIPVHWSANGTDNRFTVQVRQTSGRPHSWRTLLRTSTRRSLTFRGALGATYQFRVLAVTGSGLASAWATAATVTPTGARVQGGHYRGAWHLTNVRSAWNGHAMVTSNPGDSFTFTYVGGNLAILGGRWPQGGRARVTLDGRSRTINLHSVRPHARGVLARLSVGNGRHRLTVQVLRGVMALEALAITNRAG